MKLLFIIELFLIYFVIPLHSLENDIYSWFVVFKAEEKRIEPSFFLGKAYSKILTRDFIKEYGFPSEGFPKHLIQYVLSRLEFTNNLESPKAYKEEISASELKAISSEPKHYLKIPSSVFMVAVPLDLDFKIKYKGIKKTRGERFPLPLNYHAREAEIVEGFEAGETLFSSLILNPHWKLISRVSIFEKWETEKLEYEENHHMEIDPEPLLEKKFTGTVKYALGCVWDVKMKHERKMTMEFLMQQTSNNQWGVDPFLFSERKPSGILFDHWVMTFTFDF